MQCPACHAKIGYFKHFHFRVTYAFKRVQTCPFCRTVLHRPNYRTGAYFKDILFAIFLIGAIFFLLAIIFGTVAGYRTTLIICFWFWVVAATVIGAIVLVNLLWILLSRVSELLLNHLKKGK